MATEQVNPVPEATTRWLCAGSTGLLLACVAAGASAAETSHGAHEHGTAEIELAVDGSDVFVNFASPLYNLVGFERAPRDERDREAVAAARALLDDPANLVAIEAEAACTAVDSDVHWDAPAAEEEHEHGEAAAHDAHDDGDEDAHEGHDDAHEGHDDAHEGHDDAHEGHDDGTHEGDDHDAHGDHEDVAHEADEHHADVTVAIRYSCDHPERLGALAITAFASFERLAEVELRAVGPGGAVAETSSRGSPRVDLGGLFKR